MHWSVNTLLARLLIGSAIPLVLFLAVGLVSVVVIVRLLDALRLEKHSHEVLSEALLLGQHLDTMRFAAEAGPPGRLDQLRRFVRARDEFSRIARQLVDQLQDNPGQQEAVRVLLAREHRLAVLLRRPEPGGEAEALFAQLETNIDRFVNEEQDLLQQRRGRTDKQTREAWPVIGGAAVLALALTVLLSLLAARSVTRPVARLREAAGQLMAGRCRSVAPDGPDEVADLIVLFNHMALTLSARDSDLQQQEERYRTYVVAVAHILWSTNAAGEVVGDLPTWQAFTGQSAEAVRGLGWMEAIHPDDRVRVREAWRRSVDQGSLFEQHCQLRSATGEYRHFHCRGVPIINSDGSVREWVGTCTDMTEARQLAAMEQQRDAAEAASRAKSEFLTRMSHELRTPLNAVIGMSKMLTTQRFGALNAKQLDYLADITSAGEHLLALINDILDLAKVEAGKMEVQADSFAAAGAVQTLASTLRPLAESRGVALQLSAPAEEGELRTDPARFRQVLYNLLSNAIKFTPAGGRVVVSWQWVAAPQLDAPAVPEGNAEAIQVVVRDTGVGISAEDQKVIWDEFRQLRPSSPEGQQGTGLGLALTRRLVMLLGGVIGLVSAPGEGSTFTLVLPRRLTGGKPAGSPGEPVADRPMALVIEDHEPTNKLLCDWLAEAGMTALSAFDGRAGLEQARKVRPALVVLDINLPILDGWQVLTELKSDPGTADIPVVIVSVDAERQPASSFAMQEFFIKPIDRDVFLRRLRELQPQLFAAGASPHVLVVDDDPVARKLFTELLRVEGAQVVTAGSGREALERLAEQPVDLVLLDLMMPEMDGFAMVEAMRARPELAELPILVATAKDVGSEDRARLQGRIQALLQKHRLTPERLRQHLQALGLLQPA